MPLAWANVILAAKSISFTTRVFFVSSALVMIASGNSKVLSPVCFCQSYPLYLQLAWNLNAVETSDIQTVLSINQRCDRALRQALISAPELLLCSGLSVSISVLAEGGLCISTNDRADD